MENPTGKTCEHCGKALVHRPTWPTALTTRQPFTCPDLHQTWSYDLAAEDWHLDGNFSGAERPTVGSLASHTYVTSSSCRT